MLCSFLFFSKVSVFFHTTCLHFCIQKEKVLQNEDQDYECTLLQCSTGDAVAAVVDIYDSTNRACCKYVFCRGQRFWIDTVGAAPVMMLAEG